MIFISSSNRKIIFEHGKKNVNLSDIIFNNKHIGKRKKTTNNYHWNNNDKLKKDLNFIFKIYSKFLNILIKNLNKLHKVSYSKKYWETLLWRWLSRFVIYHFDRWEIIATINKNYDNKNLYFNLIKFNEEKFIPNHTDDWSTRCVMSDDWNHWTYSRILNFKNFKNVKYVNQLNINPNPKFRFRKSKKNFSSKVKLFLRPFLNKNIVSQNLLFSKKMPLPFKLYFNNMHYFDQNFFLDLDIKLDLKRRDSLKKTDIKLKHEFEIFLVKQLKYNFPTIFLENYKEAEKLLDEKNFPVNPKLIICGGDQEANEPFKFFIAKNVIKGTKLYHLQHGGSYGTSDDYPIEKIQIKLSDRFLSWGWKFNNKKILETYCQKTYGINIKQSKKSAGVIIPIFEWNLHPGDIQGGRPRNLSDINLYVNNLMMFFSYLNPAIRKKSAFKYYKYKEHYPNYILKRLMSKFERKNFFHSHKNTLNFLDKFKINIETVNSTGYLETLNLNLPTILIFDKQYCRVRKTAKKYFLLLEKANILFENPKNAAKFINKNYKSIDNWWNSKKVQNAIKIFTNKFAKKTNDPYTFLKKIKKYD